MIDNGNSGFVGERSYSFFISFFPIIENEYFKISFLILALVFFILSSSINFIKIFKFLSKKVIKLMMAKINIIDVSEERIQDDINLGQGKQQSFSFKIKGTENKTNKYILPSLSLLEKTKVYQLQNQVPKILGQIF